MNANEICMKILDMSRARWVTKIPEEKRQTVIITDEALCALLYKHDDLEVGRETIKMLGLELRRNVAKAIEDPRVRNRLAKFMGK